ncbi:hypothetical protein [Desmospora activa]|uniref:Uncharacterized protein n=1 Tax=Desmospora activa DSM 45169 TaxID=1121389 RepID=A0A2T4ZAV0_9BACL|nr:hypothetical protein [Desmospora activa]PTM59010.1 hypothetical protein C8J48_1610 [Desmospora activa DSM 45169]
MHPLPATNQTVDFFFIHRKDVYLDQAYQAFLRLLQEQYGEEKIPE